MNTNKIKELVFCLVIFLSGCIEEKSLIKDAKSFCDIHDKINRIEFSLLPLDEFNKLVVSKELDSVETKEFRNLVNELSQVEFYKEIYPTAKKKIEELTGKEWNCPEFQDFYSLHVEKDSDDSDGGKPNITINISSDGKYYYKGKTIQFDGAIPIELLKSIENPKSVEVTIHMDEGVDDSKLAPVFDFLSGKGVGDVKVISE